MILHEELHILFGLYPLRRLAFGKRRASLGGLAGGFGESPVPSRINPFAEKDAGPAKKHYQDERSNANKKSPRRQWSGSFGDSAGDPLPKFLPPTLPQIARKAHIAPVAFDCTC
jgi:hypothetical protein